MAINIDTKAPATGSSIINKQFNPSAENVARKVILIGTYLPAKTGIENNTPQRVTSAQEVGVKYGVGSPLHRQAIRAFQAGSGLEIWVQPQAEPSSAVANQQTITLTGTPSAGILNLYVAGDKATVSISALDTIANINPLVVSAINAIENGVVTASSSDTVVTLTSKAKGTWGNGIDVSLNIEDEDVVVTGLSATISTTTTGINDPSLTAAVEGLGTGDDRNSRFWTGLAFAYTPSPDNLDIIANWVGQGNTLTGLYDKLVHRPIRAVSVDVASGTSSISDLTTLGDNRKEDRANAMVSVPGSETHPAEIAAYIIAAVERANIQDASLDYEDLLLSGIRIGGIPNNERITNFHDTRDVLAKSGISSALLRGGSLFLQNLITFYHPDTIPADSNSFSDFERISRIQNILHNQALLANRWKNKTIVTSVEAVTDPISRSNAIDGEIVKGDVLGLIANMTQKAWIRDPKISNQSIVVTTRPGGNGFDISVNYILSGNAKIRDIMGFVDTSLTLVTST